MPEEGVVQHLRNAIQVVVSLRTDLATGDAIISEDMAALQRRLESALTQVQEVRDFLLGSPRDAFTSDSFHVSFVEAGRQLH